MSHRSSSVIHVGFTNTGTTSLQLNFFSRRKDIFYVGEPYRDRGGLFSSLRFVEDFRYDETQISLECLELIFGRSEGKTVVVSDETLCDSPQLYFAPNVLPRDVIASRLFRLFQPAQIVFTIRKQEEYVTSMYLNLKRNSGFFDRMPVPPLSRWYRGMLSQVRTYFLQNIDFSEAIALYEQIFGRENILVLPLEQLVVDGPKKYLQTLCDFIGLDLSEEDIHHYADARNVRMSQRRSMACELLPDDRFAALYEGLGQEFGRERLDQFLDTGERAEAALGEEDLSDLTARVGSGNRRLAEEYGLDLERYGYTLAAKPSALAKPVRIAPVRDDASGRTDHLVAVIEAQRKAKGKQIAAMRKSFATERGAFQARIGELQASLDAERDAQARQVAQMRETFAAEREAAAARIGEVEGTLKLERAAFGARIGELEAVLNRDRKAFVTRIDGLEQTLDDQRTGHGKQITEMQEIFALEREAMAARIREVDARLQGEREAFVARIDELHASLDGERVGHAKLIADMQAILAAEREAFVARIHALETSLGRERAATAKHIADMQETSAAEREASLARISELDEKLKVEREAFLARIRELETSPNADRQAQES